MTVKELRRALKQYGGSEEVGLSVDDRVFALDDVHLVDSNTLVLGSVERHPI